MYLLQVNILGEHKYRDEKGNKYPDIERFRNRTSLPEIEVQESQRKRKKNTESYFKVYDDCKSTIDLPLPIRQLLQNTTETKNTHLRKWLLLYYHRIWKGSLHQTTAEMKHNTIKEAQVA